jgi:hypothetical protein
MSSRQHPFHPARPGNAHSGQSATDASLSKRRTPTTLKFVARIVIFCLGVPIWLPPLLVMVGLYIVLCIFFLPSWLIWRHREHAKFRRLYAGRLLPVKELHRYFDRGEGTLIIDGGCKHEANCVFWTPDRALMAGPQPPCLPPDSHGDPWATREFIDWCRIRYVDPQTGSAMAVDPSASAWRLSRRIRRRRSGADLVLLSDGWLEIIAVSSPAADAAREN